MLIKALRIPLIMIITTLFACSPSLPTSDSNVEASSEVLVTSSEKEEVMNKQVHIPALPDGSPIYSSAQLMIEDHEVPLLNVKVNSNHVFAYPDPERIDSAYGRLFMRGRIEFTLITTYDINAATKVYPSQFNITAEHNLTKKTIKFIIYEPGIYIIEPNDNPALAIHLRIFDIEEMLDLTLIENRYPEHEIIYFAPGIHTSTNSDFIDANNYINLSNNQVLFIDEGAIVSARIQGDHVSNVVIEGHGIISGQAFLRKQQIVPVDFIKSKNITINNISIIDPAAWTLNLYFVEDSHVNNVSIISSRANGDGVTIQSSTNIVVENVFVRAFDDALVVKNYAYPYGNKDRSTHGSSSNIIFKNCFLWVDLAQAMEIGYETAGEFINDITFENITVFHAFHKAVISVHNSNYANLNNITFRNITVENLQTGRGDAGSNNELIDIKTVYSTIFGDKAVGATEVGSVYDLDISNVLVKRKDNGNNAKITLHGQKDNRIDYLDRLSVISDVTLSHITIINKNVNDNYTYLNTNEYVSNLTIVSGTATGHLITRKYTSEQLNLLLNPIEFI